ncbi:DUF1365 domain-containing protein [Fuscibacter oryzae]|uniref:DUF1365 domain-containing protein n=1 Tax=Fuscibacter oryzae TaxID=2803939 RepID=A0A8J7MR47_9RHOB|nr:DUF1365 domain-containing protein [Fuscibacter oryzae]MBL4927325.1 DUF1365 domain-containing protein [Fuscibacter oryzae]
MRGLAASLAAGEVRRIPAQTTHARRGGIRHAFRYHVDYMILCPETARPRQLFSIDRLNLASFHSRDHGGPRGQGRGAAWAREVLGEAGLDTAGLTIALITQPRLLGLWFTPVSFWLALCGDDLLAVIAEVNNTFGHRHSYLCHLPDFAPITPQDEMVAQKVFYVSPFQRIAGSYRFHFDLRPDRFGVRIAQIDGAEGLIATMTGPITPLRSRDLLASLIRRPGGAARVLTLIFWNALRLRLKGARYQSPPPPPAQEISR